MDVRCDAHRISPTVLDERPPGAFWIAAHELDDRIYPSQTCIGLDDVERTLVEPTSELVGVDELLASGDGDTRPTAQLPMVLERSCDRFFDEAEPEGHDSLDEPHGSLHIGDATAHIEHQRHAGQRIMHGPDTLDERLDVDGGWRRRTLEVRTGATRRRRPHLVRRETPVPKGRRFLDHRSIRGIGEEHPGARIDGDTGRSCRHGRAHGLCQQLVGGPACDVPAEVPGCLGESGDDRGAGRTSVGVDAFGGDLAEQSDQRVHLDADDRRADRAERIEQRRHRCAVGARFAPADESCVRHDLEQKCAVRDERRGRFGPVARDDRADDMRGDRDDARPPHQCTWAVGTPRSPETGLSSSRTQPPISELR